MILYDSPYSYNARRCVAVIRQLGLTVERQNVDLGAGAQHAPAFVALNPNRKVPVLVDGDTILWESVAIVNFLAEQRPGLLPTTAAGRADALRWQMWTVTRFNTATGVFLFENLIKGFFGLGEPDLTRLAATTPEILACFDILEAHFSKHAYLGGASANVADFTLYPTFEQSIGLPGLQTHPGLAGWTERMAALPGFRND
jgi:glutathione S-transferase